MATARQNQRDHAPAAGRFRPGLLVLILVMPAACGDAERAMDPEPALSRDARSEAFCARLASDGGAYDVDRALICRREEGTAAARAGLLEIPPALDDECGAMAAGGPQLSDFSWLAYMECVGSRLP